MIARSISKFVVLHLHMCRGSAVRRKYLADIDDQMINLGIGCSCTM